MSADVEEYALRHVFQDGKLVLRRVSGSQASKYATTAKRMSCYLNLPKSEAKKCKDTPRSSISAKPVVTEMSKIMKRDILSKTCPWISTTHKDFYGQRYPKLTDRWKKTTLPVKIDEEKDVKKLLSSGPHDRRTKMILPVKIPDTNMDEFLSAVTHVPVIRMKCYEGGHFISNYSQEFQDPRLFSRPSEPVKKGFDFTKPEAGALPTMWRTTYESDYVHFPKPKSPRSPSVISEDMDIPKEPLFQNDWSTSHQEHLSTGQRVNVYTIPYREVHGMGPRKPFHFGPEIKIGQLI